MTCQGRLIHGNTRISSTAALSVWIRHKAAAGGCRKSVKIYLSNLSERTLLEVYDVKSGSSLTCHLAELDGLKNDILSAA